MTTPRPPGARRARPRGAIWVICAGLAGLLSGCLPPDPDFGECNRDADCAGGRCVDRRCVVLLGDDAALDGGPPDRGPQLACDAPAIPASERRAPGAGQCTGPLTGGDGCTLPGFVELPAGRFMMGSPPDEPGHQDGGRYDETRHEVTLTRGFWLKATEVTREEWSALTPLMPLPRPPSEALGCAEASCPIPDITWWDALAWCNARSAQEGLPPCYRLEGCSVGERGLTCADLTVEASGRNPLNCLGYRLPTEAEWEYAVRAGTETPLYSGPADGGDLDPALDPIGWYEANADGRPHPVGLKAPNGWGLFDMSGNVYEWVWDSTGAYRPGPAVDPLGPSGAQVVARGGSFSRPAVLARSASRLPAPRSSPMGFRPARTVINCGDGLCAPGEAPSTCPADCPLGDFEVIPAARSILGSPEDEPGRQTPARGAPWGEPLHGVRLQHSLWMQATEVTVAQWDALGREMDAAGNPAARADCADCPVEQVTWWEALAWCNARSRSEGLAPCYTLESCRGRIGEGMVCEGVTVEAPGERPVACVGYRLPTEAEWEHAARAGATTAWHHADITEPEVDPALGSIGWYAANSDGATHPVGRRAASCWGLYDVAGNVHEWTWDAPLAYPALALDPAAAIDANVGDRVVRGGGFDSTAAQTRAAARMELSADTRSPAVGFRPVRTIPVPVTSSAWAMGAQRPGGGWVFYDKGVRTNGWRYLEAAPVDQAGDAPFGCGGLHVDTPHRGLGSGLLNFERLIAAGCAGPGSAVDLVDRLVGAGADDWFLPSDASLAVMQRVFFSTGLAGFARGSGKYWSAEDVDRTYARMWWLDEQRGSAWCKACPARVRAIRRF